MGFDNAEAGAESEQLREENELLQQQLLELEGQVNPGLEQEVLRKDRLIQGFEQKFTQAATQLRGVQQEMHNQLLRQEHGHQQAKQALLEHMRRDMKDLRDRAEQRERALQARIEALTQAATPAQKNNLKRREVEELDDEIQVLKPLVAFALAFVPVARLRCCAVSRLCICTCLLLRCLTLTSCVVACRGAEAGE